MRSSEQGGYTRSSWAGNWTERHVSKLRGLGLCARCKASLSLGMHDRFASSVPEPEQRAWCWLLSVWMIRPEWWSLSVKCSLWLCLGVVLPAPCLVPFLLLLSLGQLPPLSGFHLHEKVLTPDISWLRGTAHVLTFVRLLGVWVSALPWSWFVYEPNPQVAVIVTWLLWVHTHVNPHCWSASIFFQVCVNQLWMKRLWYPHNEGLTHSLCSEVMIPSMDRISV